MSGNQPTLGQAIDQILGALGPLDDGARRTALAAACMQLDISPADFRTSGVKGAGGALNHPTQMHDHSSGSVSFEVPARHQEKQVDIRAFKEQKKPTSARQMACVVSFYLQELAPVNERKDTINTQDLEKYFKQAGFKLPGKINQILSDAKLAGYFDLQSRGEYKLNAVGYNLVAHNLPNGVE
ncbi:hypothetical protein [Thermomonas carbonis]|uniref:Uncharacterized protein n=1 Tax=Thermomonas carbonis TaxID=1463158 RepID=A0A7G9SPN1_9GAMM|nr:hypothetical protein [Thermomonas carbonis]QNN69806.1 hypothetical protein H9L16_14325 [Thermomonas carbonis]GHB95631.1 hypothetical protein GCM10010080_04010 [Thermomonas carbonis]